MTTEKLSTHPIPQVVVERIKPGARCPTRGTDGSAGYDIRALQSGSLPAMRFDQLLDPEKINNRTNQVTAARVLVPTGLRLRLPPDIKVKVLPRSGNALRHGVTVLNTPGLVDPDYVGELGVILINLGNEEFRWEAGDRIAQITFERVEPVELSFDSGGLEGPIGLESGAEPSKRGAGGFGSTGSA